MEGHAKKGVTLSLKLNDWYCRNCYITIVIPDLEYVEIDTEIARDLEFKGHGITLQYL